MLVYDANLSTGDYHKEMNFDYFMKWFQNQAIPNLPEKSALVLDNATYHNVQVDICPTQSTRKADIQDWLQRPRIQFTDTMLKAELLELSKMHKPAPVSSRICGTHNYTPPTIPLR